MVNWGKFELRKFNYTVLYWRVDGTGNLCVDSTEHPPLQLKSSNGTSII